MLPKYLVADVDDTLTIHGCLHPTVLLALLRAKQAGIEIFLNTGRPAGFGATLLAYLDGIDAVIVENGGAWLDRKSAPDRHEVPIAYRIPPAWDLRQRLERLSTRIAEHFSLDFTPTADNPFRLTDYTVLRKLPKGVDEAALLAEMAACVQKVSDGAGSLLASSIHIHFMLDGEHGGHARSKADGVIALLSHRGVADPQAELRNHAVAVGDSANDASLFRPGCFALSVGVRNIERYLRELGAARPTHITRAAEGEGLVELIDDLLWGRIGVN